MPHVPSANLNHHFNFLLINHAYMRGMRNHTSEKSKEAVEAGKTGHVAFIKKGMHKGFFLIRWYARGLI